METFVFCVWGWLLLFSETKCVSLIFGFRCEIGLVIQTPKSSAKAAKELGLRFQYDQLLPLRCVLAWIAYVHDIQSLLTLSHKRHKCMMMGLKKKDPNKGLHCTLYKQTETPHKCLIHQCTHSPAFASDTTNSCVFRGAAALLGKYSS